MKLRKYILLISFIILIPIVYSAEDFIAASSNAVIDLCALTSEQDRVEVTNTGNTYSEYVITLGGSGADFVTAVPDRFSLMPGESINIHNSYAFSKDKIGKYALKINIRTNMGLEKELLQEINSNICDNNMLLAHNFNQTACPCLEMAYDFTVKNTGNHIETYSFGLSRFAEYANISANQIVLGPGEEENIKLYFNLDCGIFGDYIVYFYSTAKISGIRTKVPLLLNIQKCYDYDIRTGEFLDNNEDKFNAVFSSRGSDYTLCAGDTKSIQLMIDNYGHIGNNFYYDIKGPEWGSVYGNIVRLAGYEKGYTYLDLSPVDITGEYMFVLDVETQRGNEKKQKVIGVNVVDCYGLIVELAGEEKICGCTDSDIDFSVYNTGNYAEDVLIELEGPEFLELSESNVSIDSGRAKIIKLKAQPGCDFEGRTTAKVKAILKNERQSDEASIDLEIIPIEHCYDIKIDTKETISLGYEVITVPISIFHEGMKKANYLIEVEGEDWIKADSRQFVLSPGETYSFNLIAEPKNISAGNYYINLNVRADNVIFRRKLKFRLAQPKPFFGLIGNFMSYYRYWIYTGIAILVLIVIFSFYMKEKARVWKIRKLIKTATKEKPEKAKKEEKKKISRKWWLYILLAIGIILVFTFAGFLISIASYIWYFIIAYIWYIFTGFLLLIIVIAIINSREKNKE